MAKVPTEDELRRMTPDERIKRLREISEMRKKELDDTRKEVEAELAAAEALINQSEDEKDEEEEAIEKARQRLRELQEEENLEERLEEAPKSEAPDAGVRYDRPSVLYNALPDAVEELERLYGKRTWDQNDAQHYAQAKEQLERVQQYTLTSERLAEELGLGMSVLNRMKYRH